MKPHQPLWGLGGALQGLRSQSRPGSQTPKDPCETGSLPGLLPSFYSISVSRVFSRAGSPFFPHQQAGFSASGLWAPAPLPCQTPHPQPPQPPNLPPTPPPPGHGAQARGPTEVRVSQEWHDCREGSPRGQRDSRRKQQPFFFLPLGELITGQQPTAQVSAWDQPRCTPGQAISLSWEGG